MINVGILGATGYTGQELVRILAAHPEVRIQSLLCRSNVGEKYSSLFPSFLGEVDNLLGDEANLYNLAEHCDVIFLALPHGVSSTRITPDLLKCVKIIDLGADFRLKEPSLYDEWYDAPHAAPDLLSDAVYGLPEWRRHEIRKANLVANPGCYATAVLLSLLPLMSSQLAVGESLIVDAKSGVSGAGRALSLGVHFNECNESIKAYKVATHRHTPEIEQELSDLRQKPITISFSPHLIPMSRGILATSYVQVSPGVSTADLLSLYEKQYANEPFVKILHAESPETRWVRGSNNCHISVKVDHRTGNAIVISALDNLVKGAAGQAVQNMNLMCGLPEVLGFTRAPAYAQ